MIKRDICIICSSSLNNIYILENVPIKLACIKNPEKNMHHLSFVQCNSCKTIQLDELIPLEILYSESHNYTSVGKLWYHYFEMISNKISSVSARKNILEIGCPSGKIANTINNYNKWFIVEPNKNKKIQFHENIFFIEKYFDETFTITEKIDIIVHSHLFEHIYDPNDFLKKCYDILKEDGEMIFGVPNMDIFTEKEICPFLGIFFEHTIFLNKATISYLLCKNNFEIIEITNYKEHSTIYYCKKKITTKISKIENEVFHGIDYYTNFMDYVNKYQTFIDSCNIIIKDADKPVYIYGASYNTQYLISLGLDLQKIKGILDAGKEKQDKYFYGYDLLVYSPEILYNTDCIVILKMGYYTNEILETILAINPNIMILK